MQVVEEIGRKRIPYHASRRVLLEYNHNSAVYGFVRSDVKVTHIFVEGLGMEPIVPSLFGEDNIVFSNRRGLYIAKNSFSKMRLIREINLKGVGGFPYETINRNYEAIESFSIFKDNQELLEEKEYLLSEFLPYSFGLEFETSQGYVPENICFRDGLIPLRDGSIQGVEYSTVVLEGNKGLGLLEQQVNTLKKYTWFNNNCSLHIHIGGYPLTEKSIYSLYLVCKKIEPSLMKILPRYSFRTSIYKDNDKEYCKLLPNFRDFDQLYEYLVGRKFYGDFNQGHPNDIKRNAKWRIDTRYFWCNLINLVCYRVNKTVEFRMLRPSYNFERIVLWLYILNALLQFAEKYSEKRIPSELTLDFVISEIYPPEIARRVKNAIIGLEIVKCNQESNGDYIGRETVLEDMVFNGNFEII